MDTELSLKDLPALCLEKIALFGVDFEPWKKLKRWNREKVRVSKYDHFYLRTTECYRGWDRFGKDPASAIRNVLLSCKAIRKSISEATLEEMYKGALHALTFPLDLTYINERSDIEEENVLRMRFCANTDARKEMYLCQLRYLKVKKEQLCCDNIILSTLLHRSTLGKWREFLKSTVPRLKGDTAGYLAELIEANMLWLLKTAATEYHDKDPKIISAISSTKRMVGFVGSVDHSINTDELPSITELNGPEERDLPTISDAIVSRWLLRSGIAVYSAELFDIIDNTVKDMLGVLREAQDYFTDQGGEMMPEHVQTIAKLKNFPIHTVYGADWIPQDGSVAAIMSEHPTINKMSAVMQAAYVERATNMEIVEDGVAAMSITTPDNEVSDDESTIWSESCEMEEDSESLTYEKMPHDKECIVNRVRYSDEDCKKLQDAEGNYDPYDDDNSYTQDVFFS